MDDNQLLRYSRQIMLADIDIDGQEKLLAARVLIIGLGGLGSPVSMYLAAAGVGQLILVDYDVVDLSNLQRQIVHTTACLGNNKAMSAAQSLHQLNPDTQIKVITTRLDTAELEAEVRQATVVVDCSDNFATRFALNAACVSSKVPLVSGAAIRLEGQVSVFDTREALGPCYRCLYEEGEDDQGCTATGVVAPLVGIIGSMQALEAIKLIVGFGTGLAGKLLLFDGRHGQWREIKLEKDTSCPVCND